jgi:uncharacterized protein (TIGR03437 family)
MYYWGWGTDHQLGAVPVQRDETGHVMIFDSWSDGGSINHVYHVTGGASSVINLSAKFVPGAAVTFLTSPPGLNLSIDGRTNWPGYNFNWAQGTTHSVSAPLTQTDAQGRLYKFVSWSNGGSASQQYTVVAAPDDVRITATYSPVAQVNISSVPTGLAIQVDSATCTTPCAIQRGIGESVKLVVPAMVPAAEGSRLIFQGWEDSSLSPSRTLVASSATPVTINATYQSQYQLITASNPPEGALITVAPASPDGFYGAESPVTVSAEVKDGYRFVRWSGDATGATRSLGVVMSSPKSIAVMLDPVPFVNPGGVRNGAGDTPEATVAPGSVISILGINLAPGEEQSLASPLKQILAGVTVRAAGLVMPLFFVSPGQINAQLPFEIPEGPQRLTVSVPGMPDVNVNFTVTRNAPGLFGNLLDGIQYVVASHADGTSVTPDSPAVQGETITVYSTGLGPYTAAAPTGFALPVDPAYILTDPVEVAVGDASVNPVYAGGALQKVGVNAVSFVISDAMPAGANAPLKIRVNGHESNTAILPLR